MAGIVHCEAMSSEDPSMHDSRWTSSRSFLTCRTRPFRFICPLAQQSLCDHNFIWTSAQSRTFIVRKQCLPTDGVIGMADNPHLIRRIPSKKHLIAVPHSVVPNTKWHVFGACDRAEPDRGSLKAQLTADVNVEGGLDRENMNTKPRRMLTGQTRRSIATSSTDNA